MSNLHSGVRLGIDIGGTKMLVLAKTASGLQQWTFPTGPSADVGLLRGYAASAMESLGVTRPERVGIAIPGLVEDGVVRESDVLPGLCGWQPALDWPGAVVLNDGEAALVRVAADEDAAATVAAIGCGTGIVAAVQVAGHRLRQSRPYAGELGYAPCGRAGTFDDVASGAAILRKLGLSAAEITERLQRNDPGLPGRDPRGRRGVRPQRGDGDSPAASVGDRFVRRDVTLSGISGDGAGDHR